MYMNSIRHEPWLILGLWAIGGNNQNHLFANCGMSAGEPFFDHSISVKDFAHSKPPFALHPIGQWFLERVGMRPPLARFGVSRHLGHISGQILPNILEISEEHPLMAEDRIPADVT